MSEEKDPYEEAPRQEELGATPEQQMNEEVGNGQNQQYTEVDLTPYQDDDDEVLNRKWILAKQARKQAEEDLRLLINRIGLLKAEEGKAIKKIDETRKRTGEIIDQRMRNSKALNDKQSRLQAQRMEEAMKAAEHRNRKEDQMSRVNMRKAEAKNNRWSGAYTTKQEQAIHKQRGQQQKAQEEAKAQNMNLMIRQAQQESLHKRQMEMIDRQNRARQLVEDKLRDEASQQFEHEQQVQRMEQEELELIMRLKNTQLLKDQATSELEKAITDPNPDPAAFARANKTRSKMSSKQGARK